MTAKNRRGTTATVANGDDKLEALKRLLEAERFWKMLEAASLSKGFAQEQMPILLKPDFAYFDFKGPTGTDPELVEHLIDLLGDRGFIRVLIGCAGDSTTRWLENRDPLALADTAGYRFITPQGRSYMVVDLSEDLEEIDWPAGSVLRGTRLSRDWTQAGFRISFAKNKTDSAQGYALTLHNLLGVLPEQDKDHYYGRRWPAEEVCLDLLRTSPPHFCLIDAWVSNHGSAGSRMMNPLETRTLIGSQDALLADWAGALKMDIDPHASRLTARAIQVIGLPAGHRIRGDLTPYPGWINASPILRNALRQRIDWAPMDRIEAPWTQFVNRELFPFQDNLDDRVNRFFSNTAGLDSNPFSMWAAVWANYATATVAQAIEAWAVLYDKNRLDRKERPLGFDPRGYKAEDYESIAEYLEPFEQEIAAASEDEYGLAWRYVKKSVLFRFSRTIPVPFEDFVARVNIAQAIGYMNDYIGGTRVPVQWDEQGRVIHQGERNIYLPQPNYLVLSGGIEIDVTKIELIRYSANEHKISWKTVKSENGSALYDDGCVAFRREGVGKTQIIVFGLQQFTLPLFWQLLDLDRVPPLKNYLVAQAYRTFFSQTMANFEAAWEGREFRIGRPWRPPSAEAGAIPPEMKRKAMEKLDRAMKAARDAFAELRDAVPLLTRPRPPSGGMLDDQGFRHFTTPDAETEGTDLTASVKQAMNRGSKILADLAKAAAKDWGMPGNE